MGEESSPMDGGPLHVLVEVVGDGSAPMFVDVQLDAPAADGDMRTRLFG